MAREMANETYRKPGSPTNASYPPSTSLPNGRPKSTAQSYQHTSDYQRPERSGAASAAGSDDSHPPQTAYRRSINDTVASAFEYSNTAGNYDPAFLAKFKADIINELKAEILNESKKEPPSTRDPSIPQSPHSSVCDSIPARYTPPSPVRLEDAPPRASAGHSERYDGGDWRDLPPQRYSEPVDVPTPLPPSGPGRPKPVMRTSTGDATTLEKAWGPLFDTDEKPTARLSQVLRGLALNLIEDYEPTHSLVISPLKMLRFYTEHKVSGEVYPFDDIFRKMNASYISHLYRDLRCEHHFVQSGPEERPTIPALTPVGFDCWMTHFIRAHPDLEFERLSKAVLVMPISNADDRKERLPKSISRRLLPKEANLAIQDHLILSVTRDESIQLSRQSSASQPPAQAAYPPPPPSMSSSVPAPMPPPPTAIPPPSRNVYPLSSSVPNDDNPPSISIERERKPYSAQPGGGKVYDDGLPKPDARNARASTVSTSQRPGLDIPDDYLGPSLRHARTGSTVEEKRPWKQRSPSRNRGMSNPYTRSETDVYTGSYGTSGSNLHLDDEELTRKYSRDERVRRYVDDDNYRQYATSQPPSQSGRAQDDEQYRRGTIGGGGGYNSNGGYQQYPPPPRY